MGEPTGLEAIRSLDYLILLCDDLAIMRNFYRDIMGFRLRDETPGEWVGFDVGHLFFGLRPRGRAYDGGSGGGANAPEASASVQMSFRVPPADVDTAFDTLSAAGVDVIEGPTDQDWTHRTLFVRDPERNIIEIFADIHPRDTRSAPTGVHTIVRD